MKNDLLDPTTSTPPAQKKREARKISERERDFKAQVYLDSVIPKLQDFYEPENLPNKIIK